jgi:cytochrome b561
MRADPMAEASPRYEVAVLGAGFLAFKTCLPSIALSGHGTLPADLWAYPLRGVHYLVSRLLMVLIAVHVAGAAYHTLILRDGLLRRMSFGQRVTGAAGQTQAAATAAEIP